MTRPGWDPASPLRWSEMEFLVRPQVRFTGQHYTFDVTVPRDRSGHHVLWIAWQRDDPAGEVFFSASDIEVQGGASFTLHGAGCAGSNQRVPELRGLTAPLYGSRFDLEADGAGANSILHLVLGRRQSVDLGSLASGCTLLTTSDLGFPPVPWPGRPVQYQLNIPADPRLLGARFGVQLFVVDPGVRGRQVPIAASRGGEARIG